MSRDYDALERLKEDVKLLPRLYGTGGENNLVDLGAVLKLIKVYQLRAKALVAK